MTKIYNWVAIIMDSNLSNIVLKRPFQIRNADEFTDQDILEIFVDPTVGVSGPFDYGNQIIKGKMGSGKTMYLRANYIYYLSTLVPQLIEQRSVILPIYIKLSDFQNIHNGNEIYNTILIKLIQEILVTCNKLQSAEELVKLHMGIKNNYFDVWFNRRSQKEIIDKLNKLTSEEYIEQVSTELNTSGTIGNSLIKACGAYEKKNFADCKMKMQ